MSRVRTLKGGSLNFLRAIPIQRLRTACLVFQLLALAVFAQAFIAPSVAELLRRRHRAATEAVRSAHVAHLRERMRAAKSELSRLGSNPESNQGKNPDVTMNILRDRVTEMASEAGAAVRAFERAGQGFGSGGFARISLDTNFLQMLVIIEGIASLSLPVVVERFEARHADDNTDRVSLSLSFSLVTPDSPEGSNDSR